MSRDDIAALVAQIDAERRRLRSMLRAQDARALAKRPPSGDWSIVENVRHLLFAEQAHLGRFLPGGFEWSPVGLTQRTGKAFRAVGSAPTNDIDEIFRAWDAVHRPIKKALLAHDGDAAYVLERHLMHLQRHVRAIERLLRKHASRPATPSGKRSGER